MDEPKENAGKRALSESDEDNIILGAVKTDLDLQTPRKRTKSVSATLPDVFEMDELTHDQRLAAYLTIFQNSPPSMVLASLAECIRENVVSSGWSAVWRPSGFDKWVLVHVEKAPVVDGFQARIHLDKTPLAAEEDKGPPVPSLHSDVESFLSIHDYIVPMVELCPVYDDSGYLDDTALAVEHLRFFMEYLWRLSDEEDDGSCSFLERTLVPRLKFYYEMKTEVLPDNLVEAYNESFRQYKDKRHHLADMQSQLVDSDSEIEDLNESRVAASILDVHEELVALETKLERMENPTLRHMVTSSIDVHANSPQGLLAKRLLSRASESEDDPVVTHLVGEKVTAGMIQDLKLPRETLVQSHKTLAEAVEAADEGHIILLFPGTYCADGLEHFYCSLTFIGIGNPGEIVVSSKGLPHAVGLMGSQVSFQNIKFYDEQCSWLVSSSNSKSFEAVSCIFEGGGVQLCGNGEMKLQECEIFGALEFGVFIMSGTKVTVKDCNIHHNGSVATEDCGVLVEVDNRDYMDVTHAELTGNRIHDNVGPGLLLVDTGEGERTYKEGQLEDLDAVKRFKGVIEGNTFTNNSKGEFMVGFKVKTEQKNKDGEAAASEQLVPEQIEICS